MKRYDILNRVVWVSLSMAWLMVLFGLHPVQAITTLRGQVSETRTMPEPVLEDMNDNSPGIVGFNLEITPNKDPVVMEVYPGTPASRAQIYPGDQILAVNRQALRGLSAFQVDRAISDRPGDIIHFMVNRQGRIVNIRLAVASAKTIRSRSIQEIYQRWLYP